MTPIRTEHSNITYTAEGCYDLPATLVKLPDGHEEVETVWEVTEEELEKIRKSRRIYLYIHGRSMPPLCMEAESCVQLS